MWFWESSYSQLIWFQNADVFGHGHLCSQFATSTAPKLAIGDGSLGFWIALQEEYGPVAQQRCWVH
jgi:hypothetical protein